MRIKSQVYTPRHETKAREDTTREEEQCYQLSVAVRTDISLGYCRPLPWAWQGVAHAGSCNFPATQVHSISSIEHRQYTRVSEFNFMALSYPLHHQTRSVLNV